MKNSRHLNCRVLAIRQYLVEHLRNIGTTADQINATLCRRRLDIREVLLEEIKHRRGAGNGLVLNRGFSRIVALSEAQQIER